jgi:hypothetical protein
MVSKLDWPTPEILAEARRARGIFVRELVVALARRLKALAIEHFEVAWPARVRIARRR